MDLRNSNFPFGFFIERFLDSERQFPLSFEHSNCADLSIHTGSACSQVFLATVSKRLDGQYRHRCFGCRLVVNPVCTRQSGRPWRITITAGNQRFDSFYCCIACLCVETKEIGLIIALHLTQGQYRGCIFGVIRPAQVSAGVNQSPA